MIWPMQFAAQRCHRCHRLIGPDDPVEIVWGQAVPRWERVVPIAVQHTSCMRQPVRV